MLTLEIQVPSVHSARHGGQFLSVLYPKMSVGSFSVPPHLHSQHQCLQAASSFWGPQCFQRAEGFTHSCLIALRVHDHRPNFLKLSSAADSLQKQACPRPPASAVKSVLCTVWHEQVHLSVLLHHISASQPEPDSHTIYLCLPHTLVQDWGSRMRPKHWKFPRSCETNWNASQFCTRLMALGQ